MFGERLHRSIYLAGLMLLAFGMMMGTVPTSVPQITLMVNWLLEGRFREKWSRLRRNRIFWVLSAVFLVHVLGLFYTQDLRAGWDDVRTKIPLMFLPMLLFSSDPLQKQDWERICWFFLAGCVANVTWCMIYSFILHQTENVRNVSRFMSHIRLGLFLNIGCCVCLYLFRYGSLAGRRMQRFALPLIFFFLVAGMILLGLFTGLVNLLLLVMLGSVMVLMRAGMMVRLAGFAGLAAMLLIASGFVRHVAAEQFTVKDSPVNVPQTTSAEKNIYVHFENRGQLENGYYVHMNIQGDELQREWKFDYPEDTFSFTPRLNLQRFYILARYMSSKGLMKDAAGYRQLTAQDKENIRRDIVNYRYNDWSFVYKRTYELVNEVDDFMNERYVNGHSLTMRLYFWKAALHAISGSWLTGSGTGDVKQAMDRAYAETETPLEKNWQLRPHNQFLTITVALGVVGLLVFVLSLFYPFFALFRRLDWLYFAFLFTAVISFLLEDTLETQAGLTFFAFFNSLLLAVRLRSNPQEEVKS